MHLLRQFQLPHQVPQFMFIRSLSREQQMQIPTGFDQALHRIKQFRNSVIIIQRPTTKNNRSSFAVLEAARFLADVRTDRQDMNSFRGKFSALSKSPR